MDKKLTTPVLLVALAGLTIGVGYYLLKDEPETSGAPTEAEAAPLEAEPQGEHAAPSGPEGEVYHLGSDDSVKQNPAAQGQVGTRNDGMPNANANANANNNAMRDEAMKKQIPIIYEDLFKELPLTGEKRKQVENYLTNSLKSESDFSLKLLDPSVPVEEILREQDKLSRQIKGGLNGVLQPNEQEIVTKHQNELPKRAKEKQINMMVESLRLEPADQQNVRSALHKALENLEEKKNIGEYTMQDITDLRKQFNGAKPGDQEFMRATIEASTTRVNGILKDLEHLPKEHYEALKNQIEMPLQMMRQNLAQGGQGMQNQGPPPGQGVPNQGPPPGMPPQGAQER